MASFADLKKNRNSLMDKINKEIKTDEKGNNYEDERMWKLTRDKSGNGFAVLRFLPAPPNEKEYGAVVPIVSLIAMLYD